MGKGKEELQALSEKIAHCMKCGNCMEVCPVYKELKTEAGVARGKLSLIEAVNKGETECAARFAELMMLCTSCKACSAKCPCGVNPAAIIWKAREAIVQDRGLPLMKKVGFGLLKRRKLFQFGMWMAGQFGGIVMEKVPDKTAAVLRFAAQHRQKRRALAPAADKPLRALYPETVACLRARGRIGYFTGCMANYFYTDIGQAVVEVLQANDFEVILPKRQHCCGTPALASGDRDSARALAKHNIEVFEQQKLDYIVTSCGSCTEAWRSEYAGLFAGDERMLGRIRSLANKTYEISEFLVDVVSLNKSDLAAVKRTVTMHDPCHMARGINVTRQPRELLTAIPGLRLVEMKEPARCCGAGGSFCMDHYALSQKINDRKIADISSTGAELIATGCGSCRMHITDGIIRNGMTQDVVHTVQLLALAYRNGKKDTREDQ